MSDLTTVSPTSTSRPCEGRVVARHALTPAERDRMHELLGRYFVGVSRERFDQDLAEKDWVILLESGGEIVGFSTGMQTRTEVDGQPVIAVFSGDTIVARESRGESELPRLWIRHVLTVTASSPTTLRSGSAGGRPARVFWFLISSGYKTYRFLPVFFREFYPTRDWTTPPFVKRVMDHLATAKFGSEYDPAAGVVRFRNATPLQNGVAEVDPRRLKDPQVAFFVQANPGHAAGDELVCLCELTADNLTAAGRRMLGLGSTHR